MKKLWLLIPVLSCLCTNVFAQTSDVKEWRHLFGVNTNVISVEYPDGTISDGTNSVGIETSQEYEAGLGLSYEARYSAANSWGFAIGYEHVFERKAEEVKIKSKETSQSVGFDSDAKLSTSAIYISALYQWENFYIPFGLSSISIKFEGSSSESYLSPHFGLGWNFNDKSFLELKINTISLESEKIKDDTYTIKSGEGTATNVALHFRYNFF